MHRKLSGPRCGEEKSTLAYCALRTVRSGWTSLPEPGSTGVEGFRAEDSGEDGEGGRGEGR